MQYVIKSGSRYASGYKRYCFEYSDLERDALRYYNKKEAQEEAQIFALLGQYKIEELA